MFQKIFWKEQKIAISVNPCQKIWRGQNWKSPKQRQNPPAAKEQQKELPGVCPLSAVNAASPRRTSGHPRGVSGNIPEVRIIRLSQWTGTSVPRPPGEKWCDERKLQIKWPCIYWSWINTPTRYLLKTIKSPCVFSNIIAIGHDRAAILVLEILIYHSLKKLI